MAKYIAVRPRWNPRGEVVNYVVRGQLYARGWPSGYRDANTAPQRRQRGKMAQVCGALPYLKGLLAEGYRPRYKRNGRKIGSYQIAVSEALQGWFDETPRGPVLAFSRIRLTDGVARLPRGLKVARSGGALLVAWGAPLRWGGPRLLLAAREGVGGAWVALPVAIGAGATGARVTLPPAWAGRAIETWVAFVGQRGRARTTTRYDSLAPAPRATGAATASAGAALPPAAAAPSRPSTPPARALAIARQERGVMERATAALARKGPRPRVPPLKVAGPPGETRRPCGRGRGRREGLPRGAAIPGGARQTGAEGKKPRGG